MFTDPSWRVYINSYPNAENGPSWQKVGYEDLETDILVSKWEFMKKGKAFSHE